MKTNSIFYSSFFYLRVLLGFALCSIGVLLTLVPLSKSADQLPVATTTAQTPGTWTATGSMSVARFLHVATPLNDGKILVTGGVDTSGNPTASAELYDPTTGTWTATASMTSRRRAHTATLLPDGKVLVTGGQNTNATSSAELYDPDTGLWTPTGSMNT